MMGSDEMTSAYTPAFGKADYSLYKEGYFNGEKSLEEELGEFDPRLLQIMNYRGRIEENEKLSQRIGIEKIRELLKVTDLYGDMVVSAIFLLQVGAKPGLVMQVFNIDKCYYHNHVWAKLPDKRCKSDRMEGDNAKTIALRLEEYLEETGKLR